MIAFLTKDLLFQSRIVGAAKASDVACVADRTVDGLLRRVADSSELRLWIIDLTLEIGALQEIAAHVRDASPSAKIVAYGPHVHEARLQEAANAGFDQVMTRGQFDHQFASLIQAVAVNAGE